MPRTPLTADHLRDAFARRGMSARTSPDGTPLASVTKNGARRVASLAELADVINEAQRRLDDAQPSPATADGDVHHALTVLGGHAAATDDHALAVTVAALHRVLRERPEAAATIARSFTDHLHPVVPGEQA